ncbi:MULTISPECIES: amidohydrolase family protein [unclassified Mycobacterium]|uniref:amidohydrolase family protein n=1 Tax=unclassified Mycobacterium TaxID=2642494 RepID=UPI0029C773AB|nr:MULTISPECIES: amidohydrolase family protein [unclassified Mycobacterium]
MADDTTTKPGRIDFHHHFMPAGMFTSGAFGATGGDSGWKFVKDAGSWTPQVSVEFMDRLQIGTAILSIPNDVESRLPENKRRHFARELNTLTRQTADDYPGRFGLFAHLPTPTDTDAALEELTYALDVLGADGVTLTNVYGVGDQARSLGDPIFEPLWAELDRRGALVFLHGEQTPGSNRAPSQFLPIPVSEVPNETYKGAADLVTSGRKRQYPNVKIILSHSGGSTPYLAARVAALCAFHLDCELSPDEIINDFRTFYYETALSGFETNLVALENFVEPDHILFGTDFPAVSPQTAGWYTHNVDAYFATRPELLAQVMHGNAYSLLPRLTA